MKTYISLPSKYTAVCEHSDCPMAATCLHRLAYSEMLKTEIYFRLSTLAKVLEHYRFSTPCIEPTLNFDKIKKTSLFNYI